MKPEPYRLNPGAYPIRIAVPTRFGDLDPLGHVNNVSFASYFEEGRAMLNRTAFPLDFRKATGMRILIADVHIAYLAEAHYPGDVDIHSGVGHVGRSSYRIDSAIFQNARCVAVCESVLVNTEGDKPAPLPAHAREALEALSVQSV